MKQRKDSFMAGAAEILNRIIENIKTVIKGKDEQIQQIICCWAAGGHVLIEDVPGTGKTILARAVAQSTSSPFKRVQFTPDLLPSDILGSSMYHQQKQAFEFLPGPIFTTVLLGDEINRATPRTQSALLEAMSEGQVSIEGKTYLLNKAFFTIATQNPVDQLGTFSLPEAQLDRFMMRLSLGYATPELEILMVKHQNSVHPIKNLRPVETHERMEWARDQVNRIHISDEIYQYVMSVISATRKHRDIRLGASPRATIALCRAAQALALIKGQDYVDPSDIFNLIKPVVAHRLILTPEARLSGRTAQHLVEEITQQQDIPTGKK
jgi:MoxR-like ATPase